MPLKSTTSFRCCQWRVVDIDYHSKSDSLLIYLRGSDRYAPNPNASRKIPKTMTNNSSISIPLTIGQVIGQ